MTPNTDALPPLPTYIDYWGNEKPERRKRSRDGEDPRIAQLFNGFDNVIENADGYTKGYVKAMRAMFAELVADLITAAKQGAQVPQAGSPEASAMIDSVLAEYGWPANTKNAARAGYEAARRLLSASPQAPAQPEPSDRWYGAEEWMPLAWELCADECGEEACNELVWEGGAVPEPWGERWLKYEDEAKRLIALVRKHVPAAAPAVPASPQAPAQPVEDDKPLTMALELASAWRKLFEAVARELGCLPSTYVKGNDHVIRAACKLRAAGADDSERVAWRPHLARPPALVTALRGLLASLSRAPTEFELRAAAHEFTVMADRAAAAARAGGDDA